MNTVMKRLLLIAVFIGLAVLLSPQNYMAASSPERVRPVLVFGDDINYPPYSYLDENGQPAGFNIELAKAVGNAMGYDVVVRLDEWHKVREALEKGEIQAISGMFYSEQRDQVVDFTSRHSVTNGDIFTRTDKTISSLEDLRGKTVVVQKGDIAAEYLAGLDLDLKLVEVSTVNEALKLVEDGTYDYAGLVKLPGLYSLKANHVKGIRAQGLNLVPNDYCIAVAEGNESLLLTLNGGLQVVKANGEYQQIYDRYLNIYEDVSVASFVRQNRNIILAGGAAVLLLVMVSIALKFMVDAKTRALKQANETLLQDQMELEALNSEMEANLEELTAMEEELRTQFEALIENERKLSASEERNRMIVNALPDLVFTFDRKGRFIDCQVSSEEQLLMPKEVFMYKTMEEIMPPDVAAMGRANLEESFRTGEMQRFEYELQMNGQVEFFEMRLVKSKESEVIGITRNISTDKIYKDRIEYLSYHDQLTGLYNRRFFEEELKRLDVQRNLPLCIIMADVNGLKLVNDSFGHKMGDDLLIKVAEVLKKVCRADEIISRIGGDEFIILLTKVNNEQVENLISRVHALTQKEKVGSVELSISFGWDFKTRPDEDVQEVFRRAENFMYKRKLFEGPSMRSKTISAIVQALHEKSQKEQQHAQRVAELCQRFAAVLEPLDFSREELKTAALMHDIGKIAISDDILDKTTELTPDELEEMKRHPEIGYRILRSVSDMMELADYVLYHHERWDGTGYPKGLKGSDIPIQSRIISLAEAYDALTGGLAYRPEASAETALSEMERHSGTQFDPELTAQFAAMIRAGEETASPHLA